MKTVRQLFVSRHRAAARALDSARRKALLESLPPSRPLWWRTFFAELFAPQWTMWVSLATAWLIIVTLHFATAAQPSEKSPGAALANDPIAPQGEFTWTSSPDVAAALGLFSVPPKSALQ